MVLDRDAQQFDSLLEQKKPANLVLIAYGKQGLPGQTGNI
jgi:hypothetical protein